MNQWQYNTIPLRLVPPELCTASPEKRLREFQDLWSSSSRKCGHGSISAGYVTVIFVYTILTAHNPDRQNFKIFRFRCSELVCQDSRACRLRFSLGRTWTSENIIQSHCCLFLQNYVLLVQNKDEESSRIYLVVKSKVQDTRDMVPSVKVM